MATPTRATSAPSSAVAVSMVLLRPGLSLSVRLTIPASVPPAFKVTASISVSHLFLLSNDSIKIYRDTVARKSHPRVAAKERVPCQARKIMVTLLSER